MKYKSALALLLFIGAAGTLAAQSLTAEEIIEKMENLSSPETSETSGHMVTTDRFGSKETTFVSYTEGDDRSLIEFTSLEEEGQKILRVEDDLYVYFPDAQRTIRMQGAALRDSVMGSDFSYEDMTTGDRGLLDDYEVELKGTETIDGHECFLIGMTAKTTNVPYYKQDVWVDTELYVSRQVYKYAVSGRLLKSMKIEEYLEMEGYLVPSYLIMEDKMKRNSSTEFYIDEMETGMRFDRNFFSHRELSR